MIFVGKQERKLGRMKMSHMVSESLDELHKFAESIGIDRKHFQDHRKPHYDICKSKKRLAISYGAFEVDDKVIVQLLNGDMNFIDKMEYQLLDRHNKEADQLIFLGIRPRYISL